MAFLTPPLTVTQATWLATYFACSYVGSIYVSKNSRLSFSKSSTTPPGVERLKQSNERGRDDPDVIRARLLAVSIATISSCIACYVVLLQLAPSSSKAEILWDALHRLGFLTPHPVLSHLVTPMLFLGPLYAMHLYQALPFQSQWTPSRFAKQYVNMIGLRNVVLAPITEEIAFRACALSMYHLCGASTTKMIFLTPLWFGLAHVHHGWDIYNRLGGTSAAFKHALLIVLFQLAYTTLFGFHCSYLFLRTGSILPPITSHVFCNIMGFPTPASEMKDFPKRKNVIFFAYIMGVVGYAYTIAAWTRTEGSVYWLSPSQREVW